MKGRRTEGQTRKTTKNKIVMTEKQEETQPKLISTKTNKKVDSATELCMFVISCIQYVLNKPKHILRYHTISSPSEANVHGS